MAREPIFAAGGIVMRSGPEPLFAVVQLRKDSTWVLPKGKLNKGEHVVAAARREVLEETGHKVIVHEFLGTMSYDAGNKLKIVQFWRMDASEQPVRPLMRDVRAVDWLPLAKAVGKLTHSREQVFLANVGPTALKLKAAGLPGQKGAAEPAPEPARRGTLVQKIWARLRGKG